MKPIAIALFLLTASQMADEAINTTISMAVTPEKRWSKKKVLDFFSRTPINKALAPKLAMAYPGVRPKHGESL